MKIITMYLPQFHRVPENDKWWGEGFTDWVSTREAKPLFEGHYQPHVPINNNYYDLMEKNTMEWQAGLMKKYGIDGQCIYHYWFKDGRRILEKPVENLLKWKDIDMPFCLDWANDPWGRTWSSGALAWDYTRECVGNEDNGILLEQNYGEYAEWEEHFNYLLKFFCDERYLLQDGKPVFLIHNTDKIYCLKEMLMTWEKLAKDAGFPGLYVIGANADATDYSLLSQKIVHEPKVAIRRKKEGTRTKGLAIYNYEEIWQGIIEDSYLFEDDMVMAYVGYDDSPRRGNQGQVIINQSPVLFRKYFERLFDENIRKGHELIFLNAWNEWGEGMHLEPDEKYGEEYLSVIKKIKEEKKCISKMDFAEKESTYVEKILKKENSKLNNKLNRYKFFWEMLDKILEIKESDVDIKGILKERNIDTVAIYGLGMVGKHLVAMLQDSNIKIEYGVDIKPKNSPMSFPILFADRELPKVDLLVITVDYEYEKIKEDLKARQVSHIIKVKTFLEWLL